MRMKNINQDLMINIVKQCISNNLTWRFACWNIYFQKYLLLSEKQFKYNTNVRCNIRNVNPNYLKCSSQCLSSPCVLFFFWNFDGRRTRVSMIQMRMIFTDSLVKRYFIWVGKWPNISLQHHAMVRIHPCPDKGFYGTRLTVHSLNSIFITVNDCNRKS